MNEARVQTILVPLDGSSVGEAVLPYLPVLAAGFGAQVVLARVTELTRIASGVWEIAAPTAVQELFDAERKGAEAYLQRIAGQLRERGVPAETAVREGEVTAEILTLASRLADPLIVMATHGRTGVRRLVLGSVAEKVVRLSAFPVLLTRPVIPHSRWFGRFLVPLDGSPAAEAILPWATTIARAFGAEAVLVSVGDATHPDPKSYLVGVADGLQRRGITVSTAILGGDPAAAILEAAEDHQAGLIAMTSHGRSGAGRWLLGSVADRVVHAAAVPVLLVRSGERAKD